VGHYVRPFIFLLAPKEVSGINLNVFLLYFWDADNITRNSSNC
jgi:hypothetical protein